MISLCKVFTLFSALSPFTVTLKPHGDCEYCCPVIWPEHVKFDLYTRRNREEPHQLLMDNETSVRMSPFMKENPTVIYVHGFTELDGSLSTTAVRKAYLKRGDYNVLVVDWSKLSAFQWYDQAVANTPGVGKYVAQFLHFLTLAGGLNLATLHVIGFSLGAQVVGFIGKSMKAGERLPRITGLDPAYPGFSKTESHLSRSDAEFVDVIHTDGGTFGFPVPLGHADFFPNGGTPFQPGCPLIESIVHQELRNFISCSHNRAWRYYVESVNSELAFEATACKDYYHYKNGNCSYGRPRRQQYMGFAAHPKSQGRFYLETNDVAPYGRSSS